MVLGSSMAATRLVKHLVRCRKREHKSALNTLKALRTIRKARPDGDRIFVILDNLSAHKGPTIRRWAKRNKVELCFTPTYTSWVNPIEAHFGPLREFVLNISNYPNHVGLTRKLHAYLRWRNTNTRDPHVLEAQRRERSESAPKRSNDGTDQTREPHDHQPRERLWSEH
jgi:hypothetical protein